MPLLVLLMPLFGTSERFKKQVSFCSSQKKFMATNRCENHESSRIMKEPCRKMEIWAKEIHQVILSITNREQLFFIVKILFK
jgi:hypothetical protein